MQLKSRQNIIVKNWKLFYLSTFFCFLFLFQLFQKVALFFAKDFLHTFFLKSVDN
jgi:hypothetical protein